jgi:putative oxidoreductase
MNIYKYLVKNVFSYKNHKDKFYVVFRLLIGILFFQHGAQKLLGWFGGAGGGTVPFLSLFWFAGIIEIVGGLLIILGLFTRLAATVAALEMIVAYFKVHLPQGLAPIQNQGELALLFFASFLIIMVYGNGRLSLERAISKKECF